MTHPQLAAQWHPTKNGDLLPSMVTAGSNKKVWWYLPYDDPETGRHFDFEWQAWVCARANGVGCPYLSGKAVWPGYNDLITTNPELAAQWHPTKNGTLSASEVTAGSGKKVWWYLPYDDPETGRHFDFEWQAKVCDRANRAGCPYLSRQAVWPGFNDLETKYPEIASEWHPTKNKTIKPSMVSVCGQKKYWWKCLVCGHEWRCSIASRTQKGTNCPKCHHEL